MSSSLSDMRCDNPVSRTGLIQSLLTERIRTLFEMAFEEVRRVNPGDIEEEVGFRDNIGGAFLIGGGIGDLKKKGMKRADG